MTNSGMVYEPGDVVLAKVQYTDTFEIKRRPALILFLEHGNIVVAGITSNIKMDGIPLTREDGTMKESVIKPNYIFTITPPMIEKRLFRLSAEKRRAVREELVGRLDQLRR